MDQSDLIHITGKVLTIEEANDLSRSLQEALHRLHQAGQQPASILAETLGQERWERLQDVAQAQPGAAADPTTLREVLQALQLHLLDLPIMTIIVAIPPRHEFVVSLIEQLEGSQLPPLKVALSTDQSLVAGAIIEWEGRILDYSLRQKFESLVTKEFGRQQVDR